MARTRLKLFQRCAWACLMVGLLLFTSGCQFQPHLLAATASNDNEQVEVQVTLRAADAETIKRRELYVRATLVNCNSAARGFPADPPIEGGRIPGHDGPLHGSTAQITVRVPANIYARYSEPCVFLNGGGYFSGTIKSSKVPIVLKRGAGPNNSFKPKPLRGSA